MNYYLILLLVACSAYCMEQADHVINLSDVATKKEYTGGWFKVNEHYIAPTDLAQWFELYGPVKKSYDISTLCKMTLLKNLFDHARSSNQSFHNGLTEQGIKELLESTQPINNINGRILKVDLSGSTINLYEYMIYNGRKAGELALIKTLQSNRQLHANVNACTTLSDASTGDL